MTAENPHRWRETTAGRALADAWDEGYAAGVAGAVAVPPATEAMRDLRERLDSANETLCGERDQRRMDSAERARLDGKAAGVRLAGSYVDEYLRGAVAVPPANESELVELVRRLRRHDGNKATDRWADTVLRHSGAAAVPADRRPQITDEMVHRAAEALAAAEGKTWSGMVPASHRYYEALAEAALRAALGEPEDAS